MAKVPIIPVSPISVVATSGRNLIDAWRDYVSVREVEVTKRAGINAARDVALARIQAQAETLRALIAGTFSERSNNFDRYFSMLEDGFSSGNDKQINVALTLIVEQTKISPMAQVAQLINKINDPEDDDIIEI